MLVLSASLAFAKPSRARARDLEELNLVRTSWRNLGAEIEVRGTLVNSSPLDWTDVDLNLRGLDATQASVIDCMFRVPLIPGGGSREFVFRTPINRAPRACELGILDGLRSEPPPSELSELRVSRASWQKRNGLVLVQGTLLNSSELDWTEVAVRFRGFDKANSLLVEGVESVNVVPGHGAKDFSFQVPAQWAPSRGELALVAGRRSEAHQPDLPGLAISKAQWQERNGHLVVSGRLSNDSEFIWSDVQVHLRGFDVSGYSVVSTSYTLSVGPKSANDFTFQVPVSKKPQRCEIGLLSGTSARALPPEELRRVSWDDLPGLTVQDTSWQRDAGGILVKATILNGTPRSWSDLRVNFRGFDSAGKSIVNGDYTVASLQGNGATSFAFVAPGSGVPARCEIGLVSGTPAEEPGRESLTQVSLTSTSQPGSAPRTSSPSTPPPVPTRVKITPRPAIKPITPATPSPAPVTVAVAVPKNTSGAPRVALSGLFLIDTSWHEREGRVYVRGTVLNASEFGWSNVLVNIRGVDESGNMVLDENYKITTVAGHAACDFYFQVVPKKKPSRCDFGFLGGVR